MTIELIRISLVLPKFRRAAWPIDMKDEIVRKVMSEMGRKGGKVGGKRSLETMTPKERTERARKAAAVSAKVRAKKAAAKRRSARPTNGD
jgi:hypothetical protein